MAQQKATENKKITEISETLVNLTIKEVQALLDNLKEQHGIEPAAAAPVAVAAAPSADKQAEEKTNFTVTLKSFGKSKLAVIKALRAFPNLGLGLKEAKEIADNAPKTIKENMPKAEAEALKKAIEEAEGAEVTLQ